MLLDVLRDAGWFVYPLGACSFLSIIIIVDRWFALRKGRIFSTATGGSSLIERITQKKKDPATTDSSLQAYAQWEVNRLEKGLFILDICASAAPLIGLLGTVTGLVSVFGTFTVGSDIQSSSAFAQGVALALTTTMLGIAIALPALVASAYFSRRIEAISYEVQLLMEEK